MTNTDKSFYSLMGSLAVVGGVFIATDDLNGVNVFCMFALFAMSGICFAHSALLPVDRE